ncbi:MAG TPA: hypothetical protein VE422_36720 [Terriglobia bacterium]|nr:hypothetical protein [Terriglobia bacterium]
MFSRTPWSIQSMLVLAFVFLWYPASLESAQVFRSDDPVSIDRDNLPVSMVVRRKINDYDDFLENTFFKVGERKKQRAVNINTLGEVPNSSWFTNRIGAGVISPEQLVQGANRGEGPAPGKLTVIGGKTQGVTPGFTIKDSLGDTYFLKFDPATNPQMATSAEMISSKFFDALGYNVPEYYLINFNPSDLEIPPGATIRNELDDRIPLTKKFVDKLVSKVAHNEDGSIRAIASKLIPGSNVGPFKFYSTRGDDPNDIFPHEHRRELRGYYIFCSWLNHDDSRSVNTADFYVGSNGQGSVKHYLIDFGSTLGSGSLTAQKLRPGNENIFEARPTFARMFSFGIWLPSWVSVGFPDFPTIGRIEADFFQPDRWKPEYPNPAFQNMDAEDAFWATRLVLMFRDQDIRSMATAGRISNKVAEEYLVSTLIKRRDKVGNYWLRQVSPLDGFRVVDGELMFEDLLVKYGFDKEMRQYNASFASFDNKTGAKANVGTGSANRQGRLPLPAMIATAAENSFHVVTLTADSHAVDVFLKSVSGTQRIVGIQRK